MNYKMVVFDIAGTTLTDKKYSVANAFQWAMNDFGVMVDSNSVKRVMGYKKSEAIEIMLKESGVSYNEDSIETIHNNFLKILNRHYSDNKISEIEGASEVFRLLKENGIKIALNTGFGRSTTDIIISRLGWLENSLIDDTITSDEVESGRPAPDMIQQLAIRNNISDHKQIVKVGDTPSDLLEGRNANCGMVIGVLYGTHTKEELMEYDHDHLIDHINELPNLVLENQPHQ